jgi:F-type H+-transporting ATPase subunit b
MSEIMHQLGIEPATIVVEMVGFILLLLLLKRFLWQPVTGYLQQRQADIAQTYDKVEQTRQEMERLRSEYEQRLANIEAEARAQIQQAVKEAQQMREQILAEARQQAEKMVRDAEETIRYEREKALAEMRTQVVELTLLATSRILQEDVDDARHRKMVQDFIDQVATSV